MSDSFWTAKIKPDIYLNLTVKANTQRLHRSDSKADHLHPRDNKYTEGHHFDGFHRLNSFSFDEFCRERGKKCNTPVAFLEQWN